MRKKMNRTKLYSLVFVLVLSGLVTPLNAAESTDSYTLLVQQSPPDAGSVSPGGGVHKVQIGETVSLSAIPKPGYRFLYWLGDVSVAGTSDTTVQLDSPKMVVAVFTRQAYEEELPGVRQIQGIYSSSGGGRFIGTPISSPAAINPGDYYDPGDYIINYPDYPDYPEEEETGNDDVPVPGENSDDIPVPGEDGTEVPEPTTVLLLGLGSLAIFKRK